MSKQSERSNQITAANSDTRHREQVNGMAASSVAEAMEDRPVPHSRLTSLARRG
jgi:hypothetical protein